MLFLSTSQGLINFIPNFHGYRIAATIKRGNAFFAYDMRLRVGQ